MTEPMIDLIAGAYHETHCVDPGACPSDCPGRMDTASAVAIHRAIQHRIDEMIVEVLTYRAARKTNT